jgi:putative transcriptional regulator
MNKRKGTTKAGQSILQGAREALAYARGEKNHGSVVHVPEDIDVKAIRRQAHMSQSEFSRSYGFSKRSLEQWEQGGRALTGAARLFLTVIAREPEAVQRALREPREPCLPATPETGVRCPAREVKRQESREAPFGFSGVCCPTAPVTNPFPSFFRQSSFAKNPYLRAAGRLGAFAGRAPRHDRLKAESGEDNDYSGNAERHPPGQPLMNQ